MDDLIGSIEDAMVLIGAGLFAILFIPVTLVAFAAIALLSPVWLPFWGYKTYKRLHQ